jgi:hypothetical protein
VEYSTAGFFILLCAFAWTYEARSRNIHAPLEAFLPEKAHGYCA